MQSLSINPDTPTDPNATPPDFIVETPNGVAVDPSKVPDPAAQPPQQDPNRPAWLPEKFKSAEDLAKAYAELESKLGTPAEPKTPEQQGQEPFDLDTVAQEFAKEGKLSEDTYKRLEQSGIKRATVDSYIKGQAAVAAQERAEIATSVGGEQALTDILTWAKTGLSKSEAAAYDAVVESGDTSQIKIALAGLQARYVAAVGKAPGLVRGDTPPTASAQAFSSTEEIVAAMRDPRYNISPEYRKQIEARLAVTTLFG